MAGDWIKMRVSLWTHPKVVTLASRLSVTRCHAVGALHCAWGIADQHADENGTIEMTAAALDSLCETAGLCSAMQDVGWLLISEHSLQFVAYQQHNGTTAKQRAATQRRQHLSRSRHGSVTVKRDRTVTREEKRREEKNTPIIPRKPRKPKHEDDPRFARFWSAYPKKVGKPKAAASFAKIDATEPVVVAMLRAIETQSQSSQWIDDGGKYIPNPATWLNQRRWEDEEVKPATPAGTLPGLFSPRLAGVDAVIADARAKREAGGQP